jgi:hypothetical protein
MFILAEIRISGKLLKSILCLALTLSPLALTAQNNNQYAYVAIADSGQVFGYRLNATNGDLTPIEGSPFGNYDGLSSIAADPAGRFLYATSQYAPNNTNVNGFRIDRPTGRLTPIPGSPFGAGAVASAIPIQTVRLFLIQPPPPSLSNVRCHVFADLRLTWKIATRSPISTHIQTAKLALLRVTIWLSTVSQMAMPHSSSPSLCRVSHSAP